MPSFSAEEIISDPHVQARGLIHEVEHPVMGKKAVINPSWKLSEIRAQIKNASPLLGEHNEEVFSCLLGMPKETIKKLEDEMIIY